jgi:ribosomal protein S27E
MSDNENLTTENHGDVPVIEQAANAKERVAADALTAIAPGIIVLIIAVIVFYYQQNQKGVFASLGVVLGLIGFALIGYGLFKVNKVREIEGHPIDCPFCEKTNILTSKPDSDFRCVHCNRDVPVENGKILNVYQVRCGYCNTLNYYSDKSTGLICESCDREIPIATDEENQNKKVFEAYTVRDDDQPYDLILLQAPDSEDMVKTLQQMLALNRNQVKEIIDDLPQTLLTGIPRKKAELLTAQIAVHKGKAESKVSGT